MEIIRGEYYIGKCESEMFAEKCRELRHLDGHDTPSEKQFGTFPFYCSFNTLFKVLSEFKAIVLNLFQDSVIEENVTSQKRLDEILEGYSYFRIELPDGYVVFHFDVLEEDYLIDKIESKMLENKGIKQHKRYIFEDMSEALAECMI